VNWNHVAQHDNQVDPKARTILLVAAYLISAFGCRLWQSDYGKRLSDYQSQVGFPVYHLQIEPNGAYVRLSNQRLIYAVTEGKYIATWDDDLRILPSKKRVEREVFERMRQSIPLKSLSIVGMELNPQAWKTLSELELVELDASMTNLTDQDIAESLSQIKQLAFVDLSATQITDQGLFHASAWQEMRSIRLHECRISDEGLESLAQLPNLQTIEAVNTLITKNGIRRYHELGGKARVVTIPDVRTHGGAI